MRGTRNLVIAVALVGATYAAYPFVTLYQLQSAVRGGDGPALNMLVDWSSVREGIKEDICDLVLEESGDVAKKGQLPAFGASFVRGVAGSSVDREFTPEKIMKMTQPAPNTAANTSDDASISWAFFSSPARFSIDVTIVGQAQPFRAEMELEGLRWKLTRVWIPEDLLKQGHWTA